MLEGVVVALLVFAFFASYKMGRISLRYENAVLKEELESLENALVRERTWRIRNEKKGASYGEKQSG